MNNDHSAIGGPADITAALAFLRRHRLDSTAHSGGSLLDHLVGTHALLTAWGARPALCAAGLMHSVFGTESFAGPDIAPGLRDEVRAQIGAEAAHIVWLFGVVERASFERAVNGAGGCVHRVTGAEIAVTPDDLRDLANLYTANSVEQLPRLPWVCTLVERARLAPCRPYLLPAAWPALAAIREEDTDDGLG